MTDRTDRKKRFGRLRVAVAGISICVSLLTTGCWDLRELQDRNFVLIAAIDDADVVNKDEAERKKAQTETFVQKYGAKEYMLSLQILKLAQQSRKGEQQAERTFVISNTGKPFFEMARDMLGQSSKSLYFEHLHAIIISEAAVKKQGIRPILDFFRRDPEMRWRTKVFITPGQAKAIALFNPQTGEPGGRYLDGLIRNSKKNIHVAGAKTDVGFITQAMDNDVDYAIPRLDFTDNVPKLGGVAIIKNNKFVGYADEYITRGLKFIFGTEKSAVIPVPCPDHHGQVIVYELFQHDTKFVSRIEGDTVYFTLDITMQGNIGEISCLAKHDVNDVAFLHRLGKAISSEIEQNVRESWAFQQQMDTDITNLKARFKGYHPFAWKKIKDRWPEIFRTLPLVVSVNVNIRGVGEHD